MNKVDIKTYIKNNWDISKVIVEPSQALVKKWLNVLQYSADRWQPMTETDDTYEIAHNYMYHTLDIGRPIHLLPVEEKDYLEIAINLEYLEQCYIKNEKKMNGYYYLKWAIPDYRAKLTGVPFSDEEMQERVISELEDKIKSTTQDIISQELTLKNTKYNLERLKEDYEKQKNA